MSFVAPTAQAAVRVPAAGEARHNQLCAAQERCAQLEADLRRSKRREEKLAALHFRLKEDVKAGGGDLRFVSRLAEDLRGILLCCTLRCWYTAMKAGFFGDQHPVLKTLVFPGCCALMEGLSCRALETLQRTRDLEYELDFERNRADRDAKVCSMLTIALWTPPVHKTALQLCCKAAGSQEAASSTFGGVRQASHADIHTVSAYRSPRRQ